MDHRRVKLVAGSGGKGASSFHSEPRKEWGGPDGGNGGDGGSIIIKGRSPRHLQGAGLLTTASQAVDSLYLSNYSESVG